MREQFLDRLVVRDNDPGLGEERPRRSRIAPEGNKDAAGKVVPSLREQQRL